MLCELRKIRKMTQRVKQKVIESGKLNPSELSWSKEEETAGDFSRRQHKPLENLNNTKGNVNPSRTVTINTGGEQGNFKRSCFIPLKYQYQIIHYLKPLSGAEKEISI